MHAPAGAPPSGPSPALSRGVSSGPWRVNAAGAALALPLPLHEVAAARAAEQAALAATPPQALMARAGLAVARLAQALAPHGAPVHVLAGPGNNGGDGLVAATWLHRHGTPVQVWLQPARAAAPADATWALAQAQAAGVAIAPMDGWARFAETAHATTAPAPGLVIDALLGLGSERALAGVLAEAVLAANTLHAAGVPVLAVDLPTGLHADSGQALGEACVRADATLSLLTLKPGLFMGQGRDRAGQVWLDTLGVDARDSATAWLTGMQARTAPAHASHKGRQGDVLVVGGAPGMAGAAVLAARAALAAGAGRVFGGTLDRTGPGLDPVRPELMHRAAPWLWPAATLGAMTVVCGCGGGLQALATALPPLLAHAGRLVLDADALNLIAGEPALQQALQQRQAPTVLTSHPLEAARLLACDSAAVQAARLPQARTLARRWGCTAVLKGSGTVLCSPDGRCHVNATGNAALATAGSGDVLAGWLGGAWAQQPQQEALDLATAAVALHGAAADLHAAAGLAGPLRASDLIEAMAALDRVSTLR